MKRDRVFKQAGHRTLASGVPNSREGQQGPGKYEESVMECVHPPLISTHYTTSTQLCAVLGAPKERHQPSDTGSAEATQSLGPEHLGCVEC